MIDRHFLIGLVTVLAMIVLMFAAHAHDMNHPDQNEWYQSLTQPDHPESLCCGEADAYYADEIHFKNGKTYAVITDDRDDAPLRRPHVPNGTEVEVPSGKLKWDRGNPTGHGVLFMSRQPYNYVYCYVQPGGV
jgi:hypothetical protein